MMVTILTTDQFPFSYSEPFLNEEISYHNEEVYIVPCYCGEDYKPRELSALKRENIHVMRPNSSFFHNVKIVRIFYAIKVIFSCLFWVEINKLIKIRKVNLKRITQLMLFLSKSIEITKYIDVKIKTNKLQYERIVFYSYWMNASALSSIYLRRKYPNSISVTRAHGYDLYDRKDNYYYCSMQDYIINNIQFIFTVSDDGRKYLLNKYGKSIEIIEKIMVSRLGSRDHGVNNINNLKEHFHIVSCSSLIPLKRVNLIIESLKLIRNIDIQWTHIGSGKLLEDLKAMASENMPNNIRVTFTGQISQESLFEFYSHNSVYLFVNVSETEGIPVSIMEANSFGIPTIATDVGGVGEIVMNNNSGWLLEKNFTPPDLANLIYTICSMNYDEYMMFRINARKNWEVNFQSDVNYNLFLHNLYELCWQNI